MKTRSDYVSNSSSCSFIINNPKDAVLLFKKEFKKALDSIPYDIDANIDFILHGNKEILEKIKDAIEYGSLSDLYDGSGRWSLSELSLRGVLSAPNSLWKGVDELFVSTDGYKDISVMFIRLLRAFFENNGIDVEDCGDIASDIDGDDFMLELMRKALEKSK